MKGLQILANFKTEPRETFEGNRVLHEMGPLVTVSPKKDGKNKQAMRKRMSG